MMLVLGNCKKAGTRLAGMTARAQTVAVASAQIIDHSEPSSLHTSHAVPSLSKTANKDVHFRYHGDDYRLVLIT